ncbi:MAG TPA: hypothetical protein VD907_02660 [Verrucomicrobiae bacterium]|nr:hypothetical protein [Verrucomicrobiae bacterium]
MKNPPKKSASSEKDSTFFLKLVLYILIGTLWLKFSAPLVIFGLPINGLPLGLVIGLLFARHDHFQIDRKIEYAILLIMTIVTYFLPAGVVI